MQNTEICIIIYDHENNDDYMVILTYFIDIDHPVHNTRDDDSEGNKNSVLSISDDHGKSFLILTSYQNCRSYTRCEHSIGEKDFMSCVYDYPCKSFLTPISYQNCV